MIPLQLFTLGTLRFEPPATTVLGGRRTELVSIRQARKLASALVLCPRIRETPKERRIEPVLLDTRAVISSPARSAPPPRCNPRSTAATARSRALSHLVGVTGDQDPRDAQIPEAGEHLHREAVGAEAPRHVAAAGPHGQPEKTKIEPPSRPGPPPPVLRLLRVSHGTRFRIQFREEIS
jgi:hypothetical protein